MLDSLGLCGIGLSGLFMCWGGLQLANKLRPQRAFYVTVALVVIYCLGSDYLVADPFWLTVTVFGLLGGMGVYAGLLHMSRPGNSTDSKVLGAGLTLWNFYVLLLPFLDRSPQTLAVSHVVVAALAVLIAIAMVLEQGEAVAERNYGSLFDAASDSIFLVDMWRLTIIKTNRAAERLAKLPADQLGGMPFGNLCPAVDRHPVNVAANEKMYRAAFRPYEKVCVLTLSGAKLVCEGAVEVVLWRQRPVFQVSLRNVTERTQMTEQIRRHERLSTVGQLVAGGA
ncbi:PAS domain S-box protein, partial [bacterium]|nr:PAS domain S-box protein [bacterium]